MEEWKRIEDFPNYEISSLGQVRRGNKILKPVLIKNGYLKLNLQKEKKEYTRYVHKLLAQTFVPNPHNKPRVDHMNRKKTDNRLENLRWTTASENNRNIDFKQTNTGHHHISKNRNLFYTYYNIEGIRFQKAFKNLEDAIVWRDDNLPAPFEN